MTQRQTILPAVLLAATLSALCQPRAPLRLKQTLSLPADVKGHFDHFGVDLKGRRLFVTAEDYRAVLVFDLDTGKQLQIIDGVARPHAVLYREDLNRIYVTDGTDGALKIFSGQTYGLIQSVKLLADADSIGYDPATGYLYIDNGGGDVHEKYSMVSVVDTTAGKKLADIKIEGETLEAMVLETGSPRIYVNNRDKNQVSVIDRARRKLLSSWPINGARDNVAMALDEAGRRLFVACRSGQIVIFDTETGSELQSLPIATGVDDLTYHRASKRLYAACDGSVDVFEQIDRDHYRPLGRVPSGPQGRTARLVPELNRYFVAVPPHDRQNAAILVYEVQ